MLIYCVSVNINMFGSAKKYYPTFVLKLLFLLWLPAIIKCDKFMEEKGVKLRLERTVCYCEPTLCAVICNVKFVSRTIANLNTFVTLQKRLNSVVFHFKSFYKHSNNEYRPMLADVSGDFCESQNKKKKSVILTWLLNVVGNYSNLDQPCPWYPGDYFIKDFNFGIEHIPSLVPEGRYYVNITIKTGENYRLMATWNVYFRITNHGILDLNIG